MCLEGLRPIILEVITQCKIRQNKFQCCKCTYILTCAKGLYQKKSFNSVPMIYKYHLVLSVIYTAVYKTKYGKLHSRYCSLISKHRATTSWASRIRRSAFLYNNAFSCISRCNKFNQKSMLKTSNTYIQIHSKPESKELEEKTCIP